MGEETRYDAVTALPTESVPLVLAKKPLRRPSARAFAIFRRRVVEHVAPADVAAEFKVSQARVRFLVIRVTKWAKEHEGVGDVLALKVQSTMRLMELHRSVSKQWERSCQDEKTSSIVTIEGNATAYEGGVVNLPDKKTTRVQTKGQSGNPALVRELRGIEADIRGIWGADAPKQISMPDAPGATVALAILLNASSKAPAPAREPSPQPNVIDVDAEIAKLDGPK